MTSPTTTMTELVAAAAGLNVFEAPTRDTLSLDVFPKSTREEFKTSFGTQWSTKVGKYTLWDLKGLAEETWNRVLFPRALDILRNNPIDPRKLSGLSDRPSAALHGWMVGLDQDHAHPTMVLISEDRKYRDEAQRLMKKKKALKDTGFRMMALAARIERDGGSPQSEGESDPHDVMIRMQGDCDNTNEHILETTRSYDLGKNTEQIPLETANKSRQRQSYEDKLSAAKGYQQELTGEPIVLTAEKIKKQQRPRASSTYSTKSSRSGSRDESDYRSSATTRTTYSGSGADNHDDNNVTIKVLGSAKILVGGAILEIGKDGGEVQIKRGERERESRGLFPRQTPHEYRTDVPLAGNSICSNKGSAVIGGQLVVNGVDFAVTVAHVFRASQVIVPMITNTTLEFDDDGFSSDSSDAEDSSTESEDDVQTRAFQGLHIGHDELIQRHEYEDNLDINYETETDSVGLEFKSKKSSKLKTESDITLFKIYDSQTSDHSEDSARSMNKLCDSDAYMIDHSIDCALISAQKFSNVLNLAESIPNVLPRFISSKKRESFIWAIGDTLNMEGQLQRSLCAIKPEGSDYLIQTLTVQLDSPLRPGNCGSWFINPYSRAMVGMVISGCRSLKLAYLLPGETLQERVEEFANAPAHLKQFELQGPTANNTNPSFPRPSTDDNISISTDQSSDAIRSWAAFDDSGFKSGQISLESSLGVLSLKAFQTDLSVSNWGFLQPIGNLNWILRLGTRALYPGITQQSKKHEVTATSLANSSGGAFLVGRHPTCDIRVQGSKVSNLHCSIFQAIVDGKRTAFIADFSTNGTFVNQQIVPLGLNKTKQLSNGDRISLGKNLDFLFYAPRVIYRVVYLMQYRLQELLGKGHSSQVYLCTEKQTGIRYATRISSGKDIASDHHNMKVHLVLYHPNILGLKDVFIEGETIYQICELAPEGDLFNWIVTKQKLSEEDTRKVFHQLFSAVKYLHNRNIMHRDIKPENILVMDKDLTVKLSGFSLAYITGSKGTDNTLCGTPSYVAPEVLEESSKREYTKAVDIWSLGVVLYICLCGFPPFSDELNTKESPFTLSQQIRMGRFDYPSPYWDSVGDPALDLIDRMLTVDDTKRATVADCMQHPWMMQDEAVGLVGGSAYEEMGGKGKEVS